jgi:O-antigen ligase
MVAAGRAGGTPEVIAEVSAASLLVAAMVFGGGSRGAGDVVVQLFAIPALCLAVLRWRHADATRLQRLFLWWAIAAAAFVLLQLIPLPAAWFASLPQRAAVLGDLHRAGLQPDHLPLTLDRWGTVRTGLSFASFAAMALLASTLSARARQRLWTVALLAAVPMALLGFSQAAAGAASPLRFYDYHHPIGAIGLFANRNHFADLLGLLLPFALVFALQAQERLQRGLAVGWYALGIVLLLASALSFSRAGFAVTILGLLASIVLLLLRRRESGGGRMRHLLPVLALATAVLGIATYAWDGIAARLAQDPLDDLRWQYVHYGLDALRAWLPLGSGFGTFRFVYAPFEPIGAMTYVYALHAHNDLLELLIEGGVIASALLLCLLAFVAMQFEAFRHRADASADVQSPAVKMHIAATIACVVPLLHSLVDYPLRTLAIAVPFGLALATGLSTPRVRPLRAGS